MLQVLVLLVLVPQLDVECTGCVHLFAMRRFEYGPLMVIRAALTAPSSEPSPRAGICQRS